MNDNGGPTGPLTVLDAAAQALAQASKPLDASELTHRMLEAGLWSTNGKTPNSTVQARIAADIKVRGNASRFVRTAPATFGLREWATHGDGSTSPAHPNGDHLSFTDAAQNVLQQSGAKVPMHYGAITSQAIAQGLITTSGLTPKRTMYVQLMGEIERRTKRADAQRFIRYPRGMFGLAAWSDADPQAQVAAHNRQTKKDLRQRLFAMDPGAFEVLVGALLTSLGYQGVEVTKRHGDGGVDVRAVLVVGDVIRTRMAVQAKRWKHNVQAPTVQQVRGALGAHDQGLIITTSDFSAGARAEAARANAAPVGLIDGTTLIDLLVEHEIGVRRESVDLIWLAEPTAAVDELG